MAGVYFYLGVSFRRVTEISLFSKESSVLIASSIQNSMKISGFVE